jgi:hypothetical protein
VGSDDDELLLEVGARGQRRHQWAERQLLWYATHKADKAGKDTNFRGLTVSNNVVYHSKGSGSNGINTVYFVDTTGKAYSRTNAIGAPQPGAPLPAPGVNSTTSLPWAPVTDGLRNITGRVNGNGTVTIYGTSADRRRRARGETRSERRDIPLARQIRAPTIEFLASHPRTTQCAWLKVPNAVAETGGMG